MPTIPIISQRELDQLNARLQSLEQELEQVREAALSDAMNKLLAMTDEQVTALCRLEGRDPNDQVTIAKQAAKLAIMQVELERANARYEALLANFKGRCLYCISCDNRQACFDNMGCMNVPIACGMSKLDTARRTSGDERG